MESKNLSELSVSELNGKEKLLKTILGAFMGILFLLVIEIILLFIQGQNTVALSLLVVLFSTSVTMFPVKKQLNDIKTETQKRRSSEMI